MSSEHTWTEVGLFLSATGACGLLYWANLPLDTISTQERLLSWTWLLVYAACLTLYTVQSRLSRRVKRMHAAVLVLFACCMTVHVAGSALSIYDRIIPSILLLVFIVSDIGVRLRMKRYDPLPSGPAA